jgi:hypothetical protein
MAVFWVVAPCSLVELYQRFRGPCCLHHQGEGANILRTNHYSVNIVTVHSLLSYIYFDLVITLKFNFSCILRIIKFHILIYTTKHYHATNISQIYFSYLKQVAPRTLQNFKFLPLK